MPTTDQTALLRIPGRIVINPTNLAAAFPHGGTYLGGSTKIALAVSRFSSEVSEEAFGRKVMLDALDLGESWGVFGTLVAPDQGQMQRFFMSGGEVGASTGEVGIVYPGVSPGAGVNQVGTWLGGRAVKFLFAPLDPLQRAIYFPRAISLLLDALMAQSMLEKFGAPFVFKAQPVYGAISPATPETAQWRPLKDVVL